MDASIFQQRPSPKLALYFKLLVSPKIPSNLIKSILDYLTFSRKSVSIGSLTIRMYRSDEDGFDGDYDDGEGVVGAVALAVQKVEMVEECVL